MSTKTTSSARRAARRRAVRTLKPAAAGLGRPPAKTGEPRAITPPARPEPHSHRELAQAISAECDLVQVGRELLQSSAQRGAAVRARVFETLANWRFGKPGPAAGGSGVRVIWDLPAPPHEHRDDD